MHPNNKQQSQILEKAWNSYRGLKYDSNIIKLGQNVYLDNIWVESEFNDSKYQVTNPNLKKQRLLELSKNKEKKLNAIEEYEVGLKPYGIEVDNSDRHLTEEIDDPFRSTYSFKGKKTKQ